MAWTDKERWQAVSPLLDELLEADPEQRAVRLVQVRASDSELAEEVIALLSHERAIECERFLEGTAISRIGTWPVHGKA